jgi:hypothetical protein
VPKGRKLEFTLRVIQRENNVDYPLGDYTLDANAIVNAFKKDNVSRHELSSAFSDDYKLDFEVYVDNNRVTLEKNIREHRQDRAVKSPLRNRKEEETTPTARKEFSRSKGGEDRPQKDSGIGRKQQRKSEVDPEPTEAYNIGSEAEGEPETRQEGGVNWKKTSSNVR